MIELTVEEYFARIEKAEEKSIYFRRSINELNFNECRKPGENEGYAQNKNKFKNHPEIAKLVLEGFKDSYFTGMDVLEIAKEDNMSPRVFGSKYKESLESNLRKMGYEIYQVTNPAHSKVKAYMLRKIEVE